MCWGDSVNITCLHCGSSDQIIDCRMRCNPTLSSKTWWIYPCAVVEEFELSVYCKECQSCHDWLKDVDAVSDANSPPTPSLTQSVDQLYFQMIIDAKGMPDRSDEEQWEDDIHTPDNHLKIICQWYEKIENCVSFRAELPEMRTRCLTTGSRSLINSFHNLKLTIDRALSDAQAHLERVIEITTAIRVATSVHNLGIVDVEELRNLQFEMRMSHDGLRDPRSTASTKNCRDLEVLASDFWAEMEKVEKEIAESKNGAGSSSTFEVFWRASIW